jgi:hypothetical protein
MMLRITRVMMLRITLMMVTTKPGRQEEHGVSRNTIAQGRPDVAAYLW